MQTIAARAAGAILFATVLPVRAHHSFAEYDDTRAVSLQGELLELRLINPHSALVINVAQDDGSVLEWRIELGAPSALRRRGVTPAALPPGTIVEVDGFQARDGTRRLTPRRIALAEREFAFK